MEKHGPHVQRPPRAWSQGQQPSAPLPPSGSDPERGRHPTGLTGSARGTPLPPAQRSFLGELDSWTLRSAAVTPGAQSAQTSLAGGEGWPTSPHGPATRGGIHGTVNSAPGISPRTRPKPGPDSPSAYSLTWEAPVMKEKGVAWLCLTHWGLQRSPSPPTAPPNRPAPGSLRFQTEKPGPRGTGLLRNCVYRGFHVPMRSSGGGGGDGRLGCLVPAWHCTVPRALRLGLPICKRDCAGQLSRSC